MKGSIPPSLFMLSLIMATLAATFSPRPGWSRTCSHDWAIHLIAWSAGSGLSTDTAAETGSPGYSPLWVSDVPGGLVVAPGGDRYYIWSFNAEHPDTRIYLTPPEGAR